jgi:hypothetical protein
MRCQISIATLCNGAPTSCRGCWMASQNSLKSPGGISYYLLLGEECVGPALSLAWTVWLRLRLRCGARPMKGVGELTVCSSHSSENYGEGGLKRTGLLKGLVGSSPRRRCRAKRAAATAVGTPYVIWTRAGPRARLGATPPMNRMAEWWSLQRPR